MVLISAGLLVFGLAVLYSASAIVAINDNRDGMYFLWRQLTGVAAGIAAFMIAAKMNAERWRDWAWV